MRAPILLGHRIRPFVTGQVRLGRSWLRHAQLSRKDQGRQPEAVPSTEAWRLSTQPPLRTQFLLSQGETGLQLVTCRQLFFGDELSHTAMPLPTPHWTPPLTPFALSCRSDLAGRFLALFTRLTAVVPRLVTIAASFRAIELEHLRCQLADEWKSLSRSDL